MKKGVRWSWSLFLPNPSLQSFFLVLVTCWGHFLVFFLYIRPGRGLQEGGVSRGQEIAGSDRRRKQEVGVARWPAWRPTALLEVYATEMLTKRTMSEGQSATRGSALCVLWILKRRRQDVCWWRRRLSIDFKQSVCDLDCQRAAA